RSTGLRSRRRVFRRQLRAQASPGLQVDAPAPESIDPAPPAGDVEELEMPDPDGEGRVDHEMLADRLEIEHRPQEQQRRPCRPGLRAARRRVFDGIAGDAALVSAERFWQPALEVVSRVEDAGGDERRFSLEAVAA